MQTAQDLSPLRRVSSTRRGTTVLAGRAPSDSEHMAHPALHLAVPARSENVALIRHALAGIGEAVGMDAETSANLKTIVSEACNNAIVHAYDEGEDGILEVSASRLDDQLEIIVRDHGHGFRPRLTNPGTGEPSLKLGLPLIAALSNGFELGTTRDGGTEVRMLVSISGAETEMEPSSAAASDLVHTDTVATVDDPALAGVVVSRVISTLAARANMPIDRLSDVMLLSDAIASAGADGFSAGRTRIAVEEQDGGITVRVGPLREGAGEELLAGLAIPSLDATLVTLADEARVVQAADGEQVLLRIAGAPAPSQS